MWSPIIVVLLLLTNDRTLTHNVYIVKLQAKFLDLFTNLVATLALRSPCPAA